MSRIRALAVSVTVSVILSGVVLLCSTTESKGQTGPNGPAVAPLSIDAALRIHAFGLFDPISYSPDGSRIVYSSCDTSLASHAKAAQPDQEPKSNQFAVGCDVVVGDVATGRAANLTRHRGNNWAPAWSPKGDRLAYLSDRSGATRLYVTDTQHGDRDLGPAAPGTQPKWLDQSRIVIAEYVHSGWSARADTSAFRSASPIAGSTATIYRSKANLTADEAKRAQGNDSPSWGAPHPISIAVVDVASGKRRILVRSAATSPARIWQSPSGDSVAYTEWLGFTRASSQQQRWNIVVVSVKTLEKKTVASEVFQYLGGDVGWSPDGRYLAWYVSGSEANGEVFVWDARSGRSHQVLTGAHPSFDPVSSSSDDGPPAWADADHIVAFGFTGSRGTQYTRENELWSIDVAAGSARKIASIPGYHMVHIVVRKANREPRAGGEIVVASNNLTTSDRAFDAIDENTGAVRRLAGGPFQVTQPSLSPDGKSVLFVRETADSPQDVWRLSLAGSSARMTTLNPQFDRVALGKARLISYPGPNGATLHTALLLPPGWSPGQRLPTIVYGYGSDYASRRIVNFGLGEAFYPTEDYHVFATRGYAVVAPDIPMRGGTPAKDIVDATNAALDALVAQGYADPDRLGVIGHSYGGYTVMVQIAQTARFKAAVSRAGFSDWAANYAEMRSDGSAYGITQAEQNGYGLGGDPWHVRDKYIENSPFFSFDKVQTPVLIVHGSVDSAVDVYNAEMSFVALRRLGKDVAFARYAGESHVEGGWTFANQLDYEHRIVDWFERYLCPDRVSPTRCSQ